MHIPDGFLSPTIAFGGYAGTGGLLWFCCRRINKTHIPTAQLPKAALLTAAFFVASLIHIPLPPLSIHLVLNGLMGIILGYYALPAIVVGLFLQAVMFFHGGLFNLGVNALIMGLPALFAYGTVQLGVSLPPTHWGQRILTFIAGSGALLGSALLFVGLALSTLTPELNVGLEQQALTIAGLGYGLQAVIEGVLTVIVIEFLYRVRPEILNLHRSI
ncbi:MAG: cobalt transporter CbiM [Spirulina sp. SIO3F2]|nr:cobalt transporter CbiM [Spirulina sp. SIO3F2]